MTHEENCIIDALLTSNTPRGAFLRAVEAREPTRAGIDRLQAGIDASGDAEGEECDPERWISDWDA